MPEEKNNPKELKKAPTRPRRSKSMFILWVVVIILLAGLIYLFIINQGLRKPGVQDQISQEANQQLIDEVSQIMLVPTDEEPTLARIINVDNLKKTNPDFYANAQNDDRLIIYSSMAIIYRESEKKIINVAPVFLQPGSETGLESDEESSEDEDSTEDEDSESSENTGTVGTFGEEEFEEAEDQF